MRKILTLCLLVAAFQNVFAQEREVQGVITSSDDNFPIPGVNILVKGTSTGSITDGEGKYSIRVNGDDAVLMFSYIGFVTKDVPVSGQSNVDVVLDPDVKKLDELVVTALGIKREKKALGYAVQEVAGDDVNKANESNVVNSLSGKIAGVQIKQSNSMGGSANIVIRGSSSLTGNNQALFVVDGVPISNSNTNVTASDDPTRDQSQGQGGYDYGNLASDINPDDIESVSVLKGAAAAALYGSRAANGVILITTKKGKNKKGIGVSVNSGVVFSKINKATMPKFQKQYGAGYVGGFIEADVDGDGKLDKIVRTADDASWGDKFDSNLMVLHWDALEPELKDMFGKKRPWVAGANGMENFFETGMSFNNSISLDGGNDVSTFRLSYTNGNETGVLPNSSIKRNILSFAGSSKFNEKLTASIGVSYNNTKALGRAGTGYDEKNMMQSFGQWFQTNIDFERLKLYKTPSGKHVTWNRKSWDDPKPLYTDNPYWVRYENFQNDQRDRVFGNVSLEYKVNEWLDITGRATTDQYSFTKEERIAQQSNNVAEYNKEVRVFSERNYDLMARVNRKLSEDISFYALVGSNIRANRDELTYFSTNDGLTIDKLYTIKNSVSGQITSRDKLLRRRQNAIFANANIGYKSMLFLDITGRNDWSSTLPQGNNSYFYPSASASFIFSELPALNSSNILSFGKARLGWAQVGSDANEYSTLNYLQIRDPFGSAATVRENATENNPALKPEKSNSLEAGVELFFLQRRAGIDVAIYKTNTFDQIIPLEVSKSSGRDKVYVNAGEIENKGIEVALMGTPIDGEFKWNTTLNYSKNQNKVIELVKGKISNYQLGSVNGGVTINAEENKPYGVIKGSNFVYKDGKKLIDDDGYYVISEDKSEDIGNFQPDFNLGWNNSFSYKGITASVLIDYQKGGDIFSVTTWYGSLSGILEETAINNDKGNNIRDAVADGGGIKLEGVTKDGKPNETYIEAVDYYLGDVRPRADNVLDASYVKLREISISYALPSSLLDKLPFTSGSLAFVGRNLSILHKNTDHLDPETGLGSGNIQGVEVASYPTTRTFGFNLKFAF